MYGKNYIEFYQNERRLVRYELYTENKKIYPNHVNVWIEDNRKNIVMKSVSAHVSENVMSFIVDRTITKNPGTYYIIWEINKDFDQDITESDEEIIYKKTQIKIREL